MSNCNSHDLAEIGTPLVSELSKKEETELNTLNTELNQLRNQIVDVTAARSKLQTEKNLVELSLSENLLAREEELEKFVTVIEYGDEGVDLNQTKEDLTAIEKSLATAQSESNRVNGKMADLTAEIEKLKAKVEKMQEVRNANDWNREIGLIFLLVEFIAHS